MITLQNPAITSNEKIFPVFAKKLASKESKDYINTAHKLALWLTSEKAYYPAARPKIIELLEIALATFLRESLRHEGATELAEHLQQLVCAVTPHAHLFSENQLQVKLQRVVQQANRCLHRLSPPRPLTSATQTPISFQVPVATSSLSVGTVDDSSSTTASHVDVPFPQPPMLSTPPIAILQSKEPEAQPVSAISYTSLSIKNEPDETPQVGPPQASSPAEAAVSAKRPHDAESPLALHTTSALRDPGAVVPPPVQAKPQPKRLRKAELPDELIARDLDWFKSNQNSVPANEEPNASLSQVGESSTVPLADQLLVAAIPPSPRKETARMVPSRRLLRRVLAFGNTPEVVESVITSVSPPTSEPPTQNGFIGLSTEAGEAGDAPTTLILDNAPEVVESVFTSVPPPTAEPPTQNGSTGLSSEADKVKDTFTAIDGGEPNPSSEIIDPVVQPPTVDFEEGDVLDGAVQDTARHINPPQANSPSAVFPSPTPLSITLPQAKLQAIAGDLPLMDVDPPAPPANAEPQIPELTAHMLPNTTENGVDALGVEHSGHNTLPPESTCVPGPFTVPQRETLAPPSETGSNADPLALNTNFRIMRGPPTQVPQELADASPRRFGGNMVVMCGLEGRPFASTHHIELSLSDPLFSNISKWVNRKVEPHQAAQAVCISLACYRLQELLAVIKSESSERSIDELTSRLSCSWPRSNCLSLHVKRNDKDTVISLGPPTFLTPEQCVDISAFMTSGSNTFRLTQRRDLSEYAFIFHAHRPTQAQLAELAAVKVSDERWKRFLEALCAPAGSDSPWTNSHTLSSFGHLEGGVVGSTF
ncbi:hypothetical protein PAXRUDRAFT_342208 [Paxillus rubicundulus Ve08.2h10]|uniref:Uncharacterized protein n=1 Tax=Paxillus rubicundulus Ve08.2h10 TaxID=930991 RepID=A0A0D0DBX6_9AGAM|nr:hypothetical protein PAXRUDRAFT_342208 [Paxillus rubicundulus Ve08.2h10]